MSNFTPVPSSFHFLHKRNCPYSIITTIWSAPKNIQIENIFYLLPKNESHMWLYCTNVYN